MGAERRALVVHLVATATVVGRAGSLWPSLLPEGPYADGLGGELIDFLVARSAERPSYMGPVVIRQLGGAFARVP
jgi:hypothetical protein